MNSPVGGKPGGLEIALADFGCATENCGALRRLALCYNRF
jgi:hypothetical protein